MANSKKKIKNLAKSLKIIFFNILNHVLLFKRLIQIWLKKIKEAMHDNLTLKVKNITSFH